MRVIINKSRFPPSHLLTAKEGAVVTTSSVGAPVGAKVVGDSVVGATVGLKVYQEKRGGE